VLRIAEQRLSTRLDSLDVSVSVRLSVEYHANDESQLVLLPTEEPMRCDSNGYLWVQLQGVLGGTDGYFRSNTELDLECWNELYQEVRLPREFVRGCVEVGHHWSFRRSAGQPGAVNLAYGFVAAALAELTEGFVYSDDSAWDYERFPARAEEFHKWYFEPTEAISAVHAEWARRCLKDIEGDFSIK